MAGLNGRNDFRCPTTEPIAEPIPPIMDVMPWISPPMIFLPASSSHDPALAKRPLIFDGIDFTQDIRPGNWFSAPD